MRPADINRMDPGDRFHVHGFRIVIPRRDWPIGTRWLQRMIERCRPAIPRGTTFTMTVNGRTMVKIPIPSPTDAIASVGTRPLTLAPTDQFQCVVNFPRGIRVRHHITVNVDGYLVRGRDRIAEVIYADTNPETTE